MMKYLSDAPLKGRFQAIPTNIPPGWKSPYISYKENKLLNACLDLPNSLGPSAIKLCAE
jgi:hypothetical protein